VNAASRHFLNTLKCPICKGQVDIYTNRSTIYNYSCVYNYLHYRLCIAELNNFLIIERAKTTIYDNFKKIDVENIYNMLGVFLYTEIFIYPTDAEQRVIQNGKDFHINLTNQLFDFSKDSKDKILNRVKMFLTFQ
jgi:hypothetical protein